MKQICLITTKYPQDLASPWLTNEMASSLRRGQCDVTVMALSWLKGDPPTSVGMENGVKVIRVKLPGIFYRQWLVMTALKIMLFPLFAMFHAIKHIKRCELLIANTPCVTIFGITWLFKLRYRAKTFLVLWDFFPYYLNDLGVVRNKFFFGILRLLEKTMYESFDQIGCMSERNIEFLADNYGIADRNKVMYLPIWAELKPQLATDKAALRRRFKIPEQGVIAVYGGAMTIVQDLRNLLALAGSDAGSRVEFVLIGNGTERASLEQQARAEGLVNVHFLAAVPRLDYESLITACDIGLVFLSHKLTVPSFPSKSLDYFKLGLPVLAGLDRFTDFGPILEDKAQAGYFAVADETDKLAGLLARLAGDEALRKRRGQNGRVFYEQEFDVDRARDLILSKF